MGAGDLTAAQIPDRVHAAIAAPQNVAAASGIEVANAGNVPFRSDLAQCMAADDLTAAQVPDRVHAAVAAPQDVAVEIGVEVLCDCRPVIIDNGADALVVADGDAVGGSGQVDEQ